MTCQHGVAVGERRHYPAIFRTHTPHLPRTPLRQGPAVHASSCYLAARADDFRRDQQGEALA